MRELIIDTETTGLPDWTKHAGDECQPNVIEIGMILNVNGSREEMSWLLNWGVPISEEIERITGIKQAEIEEEGYIDEGLYTIGLHIKDQLLRADRIIAHNMKFDKFLIRTMLRRLNLFDQELYDKWATLPTFCTMSATTGVCKIPKARGNGYKWPRLSEAYEHLFGRPLVEAHRALPDARSCEEIYNELKQRNLVIL